MNIALLGDIGLYDGILHDLVSQVRNINPKFTVLLGDNFYPTGVNSLVDSQWVNFCGVFRQIRNIHPVLGNHDYCGNIKAQSDSKLWDMPSNYYFKKYNDVGCWFLDTQLLSPGPKNTLIGRFVRAHHQDYLFAAETQVTWLKKSLKENQDCKVKFVFGHYPLCSCGMYEDNDELIEQLIPLFAKYDVTAYFSGHDHNVQHIQRYFPNYIFNQFIIGCSSNDYKYSVQNSQFGSKFFKAEPSYLIVTVSDGGVDYKIYNSNGKNLYHGISNSLSGNKVRVV